MDAVSKNGPLAYAPPDLSIGQQPRAAVGCILWNCIRRFAPLCIILVMLGALLFRGEQWTRRILGLPWGDDLLLQAIVDQDLPGVRHALCKGASANARMQSATPLMWAASTGNESMVLCLLDAGAKVNDTGGEEKSALVDATWGGRIGMVRLLLDHGADPNEFGGRGGGPLYVAVLAGQEEIVRLLLSRGANPNIALKDGTTPLDVAESSPQVPRSLRDCLIAAGGRRSGQSV
jgi:hypothetical protein